MRKKIHGFTFIEVMVSIGIFAVIASICYGTLNQYLKVTEHLEVNNKAMRQLQRTFTLIERDFRFMLNRTVRDEYGDPEPAYMVDPDGIDGEIIRVTVSEPSTELPGSTRLSRIGWRLVDGELYRDSWLVLDRVQDSEPHSMLVIDGVDSVELTNYRWDDDNGVQALLDDSLDSLPYAVELVVTMDDEKVYRRIFDLANGS